MQETPSHHHIRMEDDAYNINELLVEHRDEIWREIALYESKITLDQHQDQDEMKDTTEPSFTPLTDLNFKKLAEKLHSITNTKYRIVTGTLCACSNIGCAICCIETSPHIEGRFYIEPLPIGYEEEEEKDRDYTRYVFITIDKNRAIPIRKELIELNSSLSPHLWLDISNINVGSKTIITSLQILTILDYIRGKKIPIETRNELISYIFLSVQLQMAVLREKLLYVLKLIHPPTYRQVKVYVTMSPQVERDEISKLFPENVPIRNSFHIIVIQDPQAQHAFDNSYCIPKLKLNEEVLEIVKQDFELFVTNKYPYLLRALGYPPEMSGNWNTNQIKQFQLLLYRCQYQRAIYGKHGTQFLQLKHAVTYLTGGSDCDLLEKIGDGILGIALHTVTNKHQHGKVLGIIQGNTANDRTSDLATNKILRIIGQIGGVNLFIYSNTTVSGKTLSDFMEATIGAHFKVFGFDSTVQYVVNLYKLTAHELSKQMYIGSDLTKYTATSEKFISCLYGFEGTKTYDIPRVEPSIDRSLQNFVEEDYIDILDLFMVPKYVLASEQEETRLQELLFVAFHHDTYLKELKVPFMQRFGTTAKNLTTYGNKLIPFVLANRAYSQHPQSVIDIITKVEKLVDKTTLEQVCKSVKIDMYLKYRMAKLEPKYRVHAFEAVIGAMFEALDFERTSAIILNLYAKLMDNK